MHLIRRQGADLRANRLGWLDQGGDVAGDHAPPLSLPQRPPQHRMGVLRGACAQPFVLDRGEHRLDVLRRELGQPDVADVGDHVGPQRAAVADHGRVADGAGQGLGEPPLEVPADLLPVVTETAALLERALGLAVLVAHLAAGARVQVLAAAFAVVPPEVDDGDPGAVVATVDRPLPTPPARHLRTPSRGSRRRRRLRRVAAARRTRSAHWRGFVVRRRSAPTRARRCAAARTAWYGRPPAAPRRTQG